MAYVAVENAAPQLKRQGSRFTVEKVAQPSLEALRADKPLLLRTIGSFGKRNFDDRGLAVLRSALADGDWEIKWQALKAIKKVGAAVPCADLYINVIDELENTPEVKHRQIEKAVDAVIGAAGSAMAPHVDEFLRRALDGRGLAGMEANSALMCEMGEDKYESWEGAAFAARKALRAMKGEITPAQAERAFDAMNDADAAVRCAAIDVASTAMAKFAAPQVGAFLTASRSADEMVRTAAVDAIDRCIGFDWSFKKSKSRHLAGGLHAIAATREEHDACKDRLLEMRNDDSDFVRDAVKDSLRFKGPAESDQRDGEPAKRRKSVESDALVQGLL